MQTRFPPTSEPRELYAIITAGVQNPDIARCVPYSQSRSGGLPASGGWATASVLATAGWPAGRRQFGNDRRHGNGGRPVEDRRRTFDSVRPISFGPWPTGGFFDSGCQRCSLRNRPISFIGASSRKGWFTRSTFFAKDLLLAPRGPEWSPVESATAFIRCSSRKR